MTFSLRVTAFEEGEEEGDSEEEEEEEDDEEEVVTAILCALSASFKSSAESNFNRVQSRANIPIGKAQYMEARGHEWAKAGGGSHACFLQCHPSWWDALVRTDGAWG